MIEKFNGRWVLDLTKDTSFFDFCKQATIYDDAFDTFKTNNNFTRIIGNDVRSYQIAKMCLENITKKEILNEIEKYKENDRLGSPLLYSFPNIGSISPGTLYFMFILENILNEFGDIKNFNICEIGSGYGGQANTVLTYGAKEYTCIDNVSTLGLAKKYLNRNNKSNVVFYDTDNIETDRNYDLVISKWCLSEMDKDGIKFYIDKIISKSKYAYFEMNIWDLDRKQYLLDEIGKHFKTVKISDEIIKTHANNNFLLICKKD